MGLIIDTNVFVYWERSGHNKKAHAEAQAVLADQSQFRLPDKKWREFCKALDAPTKDIPALQKLLTEPGVFDG